MVEIYSGIHQNAEGSRSIHTLLGVYNTNHVHVTPIFTSLMSNPPSESPTQYRLPTEARPVHYDLVLKTDLDKLEYQGFVSINLDVDADTKTFTFNSSKLKIEKIYLSKLNDKTEPVDLANLTLDEESERATVTLPTTFKKGDKARLSIVYKRQLANNLQGYYYSTYEIQGKKRYYSLTQLEATSARAAFPCWDEPALKATFATAMISKTNTVNLSNMPAISETGITPGHYPDLFEDGDYEGWKITRFETTPKMSTYIVAFANGEFKYLESSYTSPLSGKIRPLRIYATEDVIHQAQFALDVKAKALVQYEKVFDIEFALPKLDTLVAHDGYGAMENWGLITGKTNVLLVDPERVDLVSKQTIATVQSHEIAHMWFGNIATMKWWDNLWLNEGFATIMGEVVVLNKLFPEWKVYSSFYNLHTTNALSLDARPSSHPVQVPVPNADDIGQIFDSLSYSKAASILRMLSVYTGEEKFLKGVSIYLKNHLYGNTVAEDLWAGIQEVTGLDIITLMHDWTSKTGYPVLTVTEAKDGIHIRQDRFFIGGKAEEKDNQIIWHVPLGILTVDSEGKTSIDNHALLTTRETTYKLDTNRLWKLNAGATGFYRVFYPPEYMIKLGQEAASPNSILTVVDRLGILNDAMALATSGYSTTSSALSFIDKLKSENEYLVWESMLSQVSLVSESRLDEVDKDGLRDFSRTLIAPLSRRLGYEYPPGEHSDVIKLRTTVTSAAADSGLPEVVQKLQEWFEIYLETGSDSHIPPDLVRITFIIANTHGGRREWENSKKVFLNPANPTVQIAAIFGMTSTRDPALIEETFDFILNSPPPHVLNFMTGASTNRKIGRKLFTFFITNYDELAKKLEGTLSFSSLPRSMSTVLTTLQDAQELEDYFKDKDTSKINHSLAQVLDIIRAKAGWAERSKDEVKDWLEKWNKNNTIEAGVP